MASFFSGPSGIPVSNSGSSAFRDGRLRGPLLGLGGLLVGRIRGNSFALLTMTATHDLRPRLTTAPASDAFASVSPTRIPDGSLFSSRIINVDSEVLNARVPRLCEACTLPRPGVEESASGDGFPCVSRLSPPQGRRDRVLNIHGSVGSLQNCRNQPVDVTAIQHLIGLSATSTTFRSYDKTPIRRARVAFRIATTTNGRARC